MLGRVLIVDDHASFRAAARAMLEAEGFKVAGEAADGASAIVASTRLEPAVVLLDIQLPDLDGFAVAERLSRQQHPPQVVLVSSRSAAGYRRRLAAAPVRGFLSKSELSGGSLAIMLR